MTEPATLSPAELCARVQRPGVTITPRIVAAWLRQWGRAGIVAELEPGRYAPTPHTIDELRGLTLIPDPDTLDEAA